MVEERFKDYSSTPGIQENLKRCFFFFLTGRENTLFSTDVNEKEYIKSNQAQSSRAPVI